MKPRICLCCGETIPEKGDEFSRNPNMCASCSSLADGMEDSEAPESPRPELERPLEIERTTDIRKAA
jgi:RNA polymerase-binding transcription factor DksA